MIECRCGKGRDFPYLSRPALLAHPASCTTGTGSFPVVKRPERGVDNPPPSSAEVKEIVELYLYYPSGALWPVLGCTLPLQKLSGLYLCNMPSFLKICQLVMHLLLGQTQKHVRSLGFLTKLELQAEMARISDFKDFEQQSDFVPRPFRSECCGIPCGTMAPLRSSGSSNRTNVPLRGSSSLSLAERTSPSPAAPPLLLQINQLRTEQKNTWRGGSQSS